MRRLPAACAVLIAAALMLRLALWFDGKPDLLAYMLTPCRMDTLAVGALLAALHRSTPLKQLTRWALAILICGVIPLAVWAVKRGGLDHADPAVWTVGFTLIALVFGAVLHLVAAARDSSVVSRLLRNRLLSSIGKYSYAIYVFHWLLAPGLFAHLLPQEWFFRHMKYVPGLLMRFTLVTGITYGIALASWNLYEKHFLKLKTLFAYGNSRPAVRVIPPEECGIESALPA